MITNFLYEYMEKGLVICSDLLPRLLHGVRMSVLSQFVSGRACVCSGICIKWFLCRRLRGRAVAKQYDVLRLRHWQRLIASSGQPRAVAVLHEFGTKRSVGPSNQKKMTKKEKTITPSQQQKQQWQQQQL